MEEVNITPAVIAAITSGLAQIIKQTDSKRRFERFYPLVVELIGFGLGISAGLFWLEALTVGLMSMGIYSITKLPATTVREAVKNVVE